MIKRTLYEYREGAYFTVSPQKPESTNYKTSCRLIAGEGKLLTQNGVDFYSVIDVDTCDGWYEVDAPPDEEGGEGVVV